MANTSAGSAGLIMAPPGAEEEVGWLCRVLSGVELIDEDSKTPVAILSLLPYSDSMVKEYVHQATTWATVTPVVLPGHDDRDGKKAERLLRKAIRDAGYGDLADFADLCWEKVGFRHGLRLAGDYKVAAHLKNRSRFHVRITWRDAEGNPVLVRGPIAFGAGRYAGVGLVAAERL